MTTTQTTTHVTITTDGGCWPNPGPGAWAAILRCGDHVKTIAGAASNTTNNRMEMTAIIESLRALTRPCSVTLRTDSMICVYALRDVKRKKKRANPDLVAQMWAEFDRHAVTVVWIKGHAGDPDNEHVDAVCAQKMRTHGFNSRH